MVTLCQRNLFIRYTRYSKNKTKQKPFYTFDHKLLSTTFTDDIKISVVYSREVKNFMSTIWWHYCLSFSVIMHSLFKNGFRFWPTFAAMSYENSSKGKYWCVSNQSYSLEIKDIF